jgi:hypothetical protein
MSINLRSLSHLERRRERLMTLAERAFEQGRDWAPYMLRLCDVAHQLEHARYLAEWPTSEASVRG